MASQTLDKSGPVTSDNNNTKNSNNANNEVQIWFYPANKPKPILLLQLAKLGYKGAVNSNNGEPIHILIRGFLSDETGGGSKRGFRKPYYWHITIAYKVQGQVVTGKHRTVHVYTQGKTYAYKDEMCFHEEDDTHNRGKDGREIWPADVIDGGKFDVQTLSAP